MDRIGLYYIEKKLNYHNRSDGVWSMTKSRQDNDVIDHTDSVYDEIKIEGSWPIKQDAVYHEK